MLRFVLDTIVARGFTGTRSVRPDLPAQSAETSWHHAYQVLQSTLIKQRSTGSRTLASQATSFNVILNARWRARPRVWRTGQIA
jgi:hypothetical protein